MFSGIVADCRQVKWIKQEGSIILLVVNLGSSLIQNLVLGASVAIDGVCLTVVAVEGDDAHFELVQETISKTSLGELIAGSWVNVERSLTMGSEVGGHFVSGHVMGVGKLLQEFPHSGGDKSLLFQVSQDIKSYLFSKGFISVNGVSLTIGELQDDETFMVHVIPETLRATNLRFLKMNSLVNIEVDAQSVAIVDTLIRLKSSGALSEMFLTESL